MNKMNRWGLWGLGALLLLALCGRIPGPAFGSYFPARGPIGPTANDYYIDPQSSVAMCSDQNNGTASGTPVCTWQRLTAVWGCAFPAQEFPVSHPVTVHWQSGQTVTTDPVFPTYVFTSTTASFLFSGTKTVAHSGTITTAGARTLATNVPYTVTDTGLSGSSWTPYLFQLIVDTTTNTCAWIYQDNGGASGNSTSPKQAEVSEWKGVYTPGNGPDVGVDESLPGTAPSNGDAYQVWTLPNIYLAGWQQRAMARGAATGPAYIDGYGGAINVSFSFDSADNNNPKTSPRISGDQLSFVQTQFLGSAFTFDTGYTLWMGNVAVASPNGDSPYVSAPWTNVRGMTWWMGGLIWHQAIFFRGPGSAPGGQNDYGQRIGGGIVFWNATLGWDAGGRPRLGISTTGGIQLKQTGNIQPITGYADCFGLTLWGDVGPEWSPNAYSALGFIINLLPNSGLTGVNATKWYVAKASGDDIHLGSLASAYAFNATTGAPYSGLQAISFQAAPYPLTNNSNWPGQVAILPQYGILLTGATQ